MSRTFLRTQEGSAAHLRAYFEQPLEFSKYLAAERLLLNIDADERAPATSAVALAMVRVQSPSRPTVEKAGEGPE